MKNTTGEVEKTVIESLFKIGMLKGRVTNKLLLDLDQKVCN
jgi:hypothetical protein